MTRRTVFGLAAALLAASFVWALVPDAGSDAPDPAERNTAALVEATRERGARNPVVGVLFDVRATGTLGEALALFASSAGLQLVLRELPAEGRRRRPRRGTPGRVIPPTSDAVRAAALALVVPTAVFAVFVTLRGHLDLGGGLQGGVLGVSAVALVLLAGRYRTQRALTPERHLDLLEATSLGGSVVLGLAGLVLGGAFLENVLPLGAFGQLWSSGTIVVLSALVAIEAGAAVLLIVAETQEEPFERHGEAAP